MFTFGIGSWNRDFIVRTTSSAASGSYFMDLFTAWAPPSESPFLCSVSDVMARQSTASRGNSSVMMLAIHSKEPLPSLYSLKGNGLIMRTSLYVVNQLALLQGAPRRKKPRDFGHCDSKKVRLWLLARDVDKIADRFSAFVDLNTWQ